MGVPVADFSEFQRKRKKVRRRSVVFGFLLYDSRASQQQIAEFASSRRGWIDELARGARIYFFFPLPDAAGNFENASPDVMRAFGLGPTRCPGVLLFAPPLPNGQIRTKHAVFLPLDSGDFDAAEKYEAVLTDLFEVIRECLQRATQPHEVLALIEGEVKRLRRRRARRGFARWLRRGAHVILFEIPERLATASAEGFGSALGDAAVRPR